jgi:hypothetical protein
VCGVAQLGEGVLAHVGGAVYWLMMSCHLDADMIVEIEKKTSFRTHEFARLREWWKHNPIQSHI